MNDKKQKPFTVGIGEHIRAYRELHPEATVKELAELFEVFRSSVYYAIQKGGTR